MGGHGVPHEDPDWAERDPSYGPALATYLRSQGAQEAQPAPAGAPSPAPSLLDRLSTPAPWERRASAALVDLLRRASTPAPWEQAVSGQLGALLQHLRSTTSPEPPRP